ncbi:MAG: dATP/dGTP diphosphohydrolase domain-containing protein, partial [Bacillota bacterium]
HGIHFDELHHVKDKTEIEVDFHVDDKPENVRAMNQAGVCAYLMDQSWNYGEWDLDRIYTLRDYRNKIRQIANLDVSRLKQEHPRTAFLTRLLAGQQERLAQAEEARLALVDTILQVPGTGEVRTVSASGAEKGTKPAQFQSIPPAALLELATHYQRGASKYSDHNFRKGFEWSKSYSALLRHLLAFWGGEDIDEETGSKHVIAVAWHALTLATFMDEHPDYDDRYKGENQ